MGQGNNASPPGRDYARRYTKDCSIQAIRAAIKRRQGAKAVQDRGGRGISTGVSSVYF